MNRLHVLGGLAVLLLVGVGAITAHRIGSPDDAVREVDSTLALPDVTAGTAQTRLTVAGSPPEHAFGLVGDVAMSPDGRTFVLDVLNREVSVFAASGERTAVLGSRGAGPGEFMGPVALAVDDGAGALYVLDERRQGIDLFDLEGGEWKRTIPLDFQASDLCVLAGRLYLLGGRHQFLLHEVSPADGRVLRSFAPDAESGNILLRSYRGSGYLGCAPSGEIAFLPSLRPEVLRYSATRGQPIGAALIPGYRSVRVRPGAGGGMQFDVPGGGSHDYGSSILPLADGGWLVQVGRLRPGSNSHHEFVSLRSHLLSPRDGQIKPLPVRLPRIMAAGHERVYAVETSPYPAVRLFSNSLAELVE